MSTHATHAIIIEDLWKGFPNKRDKPGLKEFITNLPKFITNKKSVFWAIKGINITVGKGECLGIIGKNGAGKSTLLSIMLGTVVPTNGACIISGKRTPLLELGAGFHHDMTGIENILLNGVLLGLTKKEVLERMEDIIDFSELGEFINMPLRTYSSGMFMRLAFSVAIHTDPEILLIDEILSVGDQAFQKKSSDALMKLIRGGVTTVYVSHSLDAVQGICDRTIWLDYGVVKAEGDTNKIVEEYIKGL